MLPKSKDRGLGLEAVGRKEHPLISYMVPTTYCSQERLISVRGGKCVLRAGGIAGYPGGRVKG